MKSINNKLIGILIAVMCSASCKLTSKHMSSAIHSPLLIDEVDKGWLRFSLYVLNDTVANGQHEMLYSIRVVNTSDNFSPLRKIVKNIDEYNIAYAYLLNQAKNDFILFSNNDLFYPSYYAVENNYNAFPFEAINVGYSILEKKQRHSDRLIAYVDKVFTQDTIVFNLTPHQFITHK